MRRVVFGAICVALVLGMCGNAMADPVLVVPDTNPAPNYRLSYSGLMSGTSFSGSYTGPSGPVSGSAGLFKYDFESQGGTVIGDDYISNYGYSSTSTHNSGNGFLSFCIELTETIGGGTYDADVSLQGSATWAIGGGGGADPDPISHDPLSYGTAWLYYQFARGAADYTFGSTTVSFTAPDVRALQEAIWWHEDEIVLTTPSANDYIAAAADYWANNGSIDPLSDYNAAPSTAPFVELVGEDIYYYKIYAVNIYDTNQYDSGKRQSTIFMTKELQEGIVPEPATFAIWGLGLCLAGFAACRRR